MSTSEANGYERRTVSVNLTERNTFQFLPGPMDGVACPCCFRDQLVHEVIVAGKCMACGATLELSLRATPAE